MPNENSGARRKWDPIGIYTGDLMTAQEYDACARRNGRHVHRYAVEIKAWRTVGPDQSSVQLAEVVIDGSLRGNQLREINHCQVPGGGGRNLRPNVQFLEVGGAMLRVLGFKI